MILLDTPSLIWWVSRASALSTAALAAIELERPGGAILLSCVSAWEIDRLTAQKRLVLRMEPAAWLGLVAAIPEARFIPVDHDIALQAASLPGTPPAATAARLLAATARHCGCALVTPDPTLRGYASLRSIW